MKKRWLVYSLLLLLSVGLFGQRGQWGDGSDPTPACLPCPVCVGRGAPPHPQFYLHAGQWRCVGNLLHQCSPSPLLGGCL